MNKTVVLEKRQVEYVKKLAEETRKLFGVYAEVPIANDMMTLLEKKGIYLCEYPFETSGESHTDATITWFETEEGPLTFIGLNTSLYFDEQVFALAHELYHFQTKTGKAYMTDADEEDAITEKEADRYAAELLLPDEALRKRILAEFPDGKIGGMERLRALRFIARLQCEWWLPYRSIVNRLLEEGYIDEALYELLYRDDVRSETSEYGKILRSFDTEKYTLLNCRTNKKGISGSALEFIIKNFEDGLIGEDEFIACLAVYGKEPSDFGFEIICDDDDDFESLFEGEESDES